MAKPTWVLISPHADWRWLRECSDSPWYPTARVFRQQAGGDWPGLLEEVKEALEQWRKGGPRDGG